MPILNALTTNKHLGVTLNHGDWQYAGFDLTMLFIGFLFVFAALKFKQSQRANLYQKPRKKAPSTTMKGVDSALVIIKENSGAR